MIAAFLAFLRAQFLIAVIVPEYKAIHWGASFLSVEMWRNCYPVDTPVIYCVPRFNIVQRIESAFYRAFA